MDNPDTNAHSHMGNEAPRNIEITGNNFDSAKKAMGWLKAAAGYLHLHDEVETKYALEPGTLDKFNGLTLKEITIKKNNDLTHSDGRTNDPRITDSGLHILFKTDHLELTGDQYFISFIFEPSANVALKLATQESRLQTEMLNPKTGNKDFVVLFSKRSNKTNYRITITTYIDSNTLDSWGINLNS
jgi:hypothetical protein